LKTERAAKPDFCARLWKTSWRCRRSPSFDTMVFFRGGYFLAAAPAFEAFIGFFDFSSTTSWRLRL
jgi:hypothetical protein